MKLNKKLDIVAQAVASISSHTDEDAQIRVAALDRVIVMVQEQKDTVQAEVQAGIDAALGSAT